MLQRLFRPLFTSEKKISHLQLSAFSSSHEPTTSSITGSLRKPRLSIEKDRKLQDITNALVAKGIPKDMIIAENVKSALECDFCNGDAQKTVELLEWYYAAAEGKIVGIADNIADPGSTEENDSDGVGKYWKLQGAENRNGVTCYLDSLIFAMFARLESFEPMLLHPQEKSSNKENLAIMLRLYVNMLRSGKLITKDITKILLGTILKAGWDETCFFRQQDCCDLFNFITEQLEMPMITLKVDIEHEGKENRKDDHKLINERLLLVSVPNSSNNEPILLEQCLEAYFANSIQVSRQMERRRTFSTSSVLTNAASIYSGTGTGGRRRKFSVCLQTPPEVSPTSYVTAQQDPTEIIGQEVAVSPLDEDMDSVLSKYRRYASLQSPTSPVSPSTSTPGQLSDNPPAYNTIFEKTTPTSYFPPEKDDKIIGSGSSNQLWNQKMEITIPAWMFLQLVPFYTNYTGQEEFEIKGESELTATNEFATTRPVVGICLKRSEWEGGRSVVNSRRVLVPPVIHFPSFVVDDDATEGDGHHKNKIDSRYVLVLESAVFHRGNSTDSGHFVALAKENSDIGYHSSLNATSTRSSQSSTSVSLDNTSVHSSSASTQEKGSRWIFFDDLLPPDEKVKVVEYDDVFAKEKPYILFYRLVTTEDYENEADRHKVKPQTSHKSNISLPIPTKSGKSEIFEDPTETYAADESMLPKEKEKRKSRLRHYRHRSFYSNDYRDEKCIIS